MPYSKENIKSGIYCWFNTKSGKRYVGSSNHLVHRRGQHLRMLASGKSHNRYLQRAWNKDGESAFVHEILELCETSELVQREQYWIDAYHTSDANYGYNMCPAAEGRRGATQTPESRAKMSDFQKKRFSVPGSRDYLKGIQQPWSNERREKHRMLMLSEEYKKRISEAHKGKVVSEDTRRRMSIASSGRKLTPVAKAKIAASRRGKKMSNAQREKLSTIHRGRPWSPARRLAHVRSRCVTQDEGSSGQEKLLARRDLASDDHAGMRPQLQSLFRWE